MQGCTLSAGFECRVGGNDDERNNPPDPPWVPLSYPALHADAGSILFNPQSSSCIELVASDGGIQRPTGDLTPGTSRCIGTSPDWTYSDRGMRALEPYDLSLTSILGTRRTDVYAAAQDNGAYALLAGDAGWHHFDGGNDGYQIDATSAVRTDQLHSIHVLYDGDGFQHLLGRGFTDDRLALFDPFSNPPGVSPMNRGWPWSGLQSPQQVSELFDGRLIMAVAPSGSGPLAAQTALFTSGDGSHWAQVLPGGNEFLAGRTATDGTVPDLGTSVIATGTVAAPTEFVRSFGDLYRVNGAGFASVGRLLAGSSAGPDDVGAFSVADPQHLLVFSCPPSGCAAGSVQGEQRRRGHLAHPVDGDPPGRERRLRRVLSA